MNTDAGYSEMTALVGALAVGCWGLVVTALIFMSKGDDGAVNMLIGCGFWAVVLTVFTVACIRAER